MTFSDVCLALTVLRQFIVSWSCDLISWSLSKTKTSSLCFGFGLEVCAVSHHSETDYEN